MIKCRCLFLMHCHNESELRDKETSLYKAGDKMEGAGTLKSSRLGSNSTFTFYWSCDIRQIN